MLLHSSLKLAINILLQVEEALPDNTEPKRGGFYVNTGKLEYKKVYDYFDIKKVKVIQISSLLFRE